MIFNVNNSNTDRPANSTVDNNKSLSWINSVERKAEIYSFPLAVPHRLQNSKNITISYLSINSLRNKIEAVEELISKNSDICLLRETKIDETFPIHPVVLFELLLIKILVWSQDFMNAFNL